MLVQSASFEVRIAAENVIGEQAVEVVQLVATGMMAKVRAADLAGPRASGWEQSEA